MKTEKKNLCVLILFLFSFTLSLNIPTVHSIPYELDSIPFYGLIRDSFGLTDDEINLLADNKFIVLNRMGTEDLLDAYKYYWTEDLPIFITTDTLLHTWHLIFDHSLEDIEECIFYPLFSYFLGALASRALVEYDNNLISNYTLTYIIVAAELANSTYETGLPISFNSNVGIIINAINQEISLPEAIGQFDSNILKRFIDDFSQYKPRGHYIHSEILKNYFRVFKWLSRIPFFFDKYAGYPYLQSDHEDMIKSALEITWMLKDTSIKWQGHSLTGFKILEVFNKFLKVVVGTPNSVSPQCLDYICNGYYGENWDLNDVNILQIKNSVLINDSIPVPEAAFVIDAFSESIFSPKTFTIFGEILTLDSYALNHLVYPYVPSRYLPVGLDFASTCLNSSRSKDLLSENYIQIPDYKNTTLALIDEINNTSGDKKMTIQWKWIESLKNLAVNEPECDEQISLPEFMNSTAWLDEKLTTIMGSYAQLRHDLILYQKQSITGFICSTPMGYVEPYPEFYKSLGNISDLYKSSLTPLEDIGYNLTDSEHYYFTVLDELHNATIMLEMISNKELKGNPLNEEEKLFIIETYGEVQSNICGDPGDFRGWLPSIIKKLDDAYDKPDFIPNSRVSLVADIHTDLNSDSVLHIATGLFEPIIAIVPGWNGEDIAVVGPVFSYYEFALSGYQRLNDNEWGGILKLWLDCDDRNMYDFNLFERGFWSENYMVSTNITNNRIYYDNVWFSPPIWFANISNPYDPYDPDEPPNPDNLNLIDVLIIGLIAIPLVIVISNAVKKGKRI